MALRLKRDALCLEAAMVDPGVNVEFGQAFIGELGPALPLSLDRLGAVPISHLLAKTVLVPIHPDLARRIIWASKWVR